MTLDFTDRAQFAKQRAAARPPVLEEATVTAAPASGWVQVNSSGVSESVILTRYVDLAIGDRALIARQGGAAWAVGKVAGRVLAPTGKVTSAPPGSYITVTVTGGASYSLPFLASYTPAVNDNVAIMWGASGEGGVVLGKCGTVAAAGGGSAPSTPIAPPTVGQSGSKDFPAIDSGQYRSGKWGAAGDRTVYQGDWGYGDNKGAWFYGTTPKDLIGPGATVTACRVRISRKSGGTYGPQSAHLYLHGSASKPAGDVTRSQGPVDASIDIGASAWVDLPASWGQSIVDNAGGLGVSGSPYVVLNGIDNDPESGLLHLDWTK